MSTQSSQTERAAIDAARRYLEVYGADLEKWPQAARTAYGDQIAHSALSQERSEANVLDELLRSASAPSADSALNTRLINNFDISQKRFLAKEWAEIFDPLSVFGRFVPASAAAMLVLLGGVLGLLTSSLTATSSQEFDTASYVEEAFTIAFVEDEEALLWVED